MTDQSIVRLADAPEWLEQAAEWFHGKWHVPVEAYRESMEESLRGENPVPSRMYIHSTETRNCPSAWQHPGRGAFSTEFTDCS